MLYANFKSKQRMSTCFKSYIIWNLRTRRDNPIPNSNSKNEMETAGILLVAPAPEARVFQWAVT